ncbi:nucleoside-diphosphate-sugar [Moniliophthora roreri MCA 2997]|uniref:Nucleoside-diphosphate-sugar n=2 Tax=Moniliophthora roreri TaxID=221103 RepID=V2YUR1_MONRO|nr:nucleoside-diphosphate-sugar [Moniliophthora roreri MCA 2997]KAI3611457.1 nucleoside-diphosphate-sugar [Moniliophthora roreri]
MSDKNVVMITGAAGWLGGLLPKALVNDSKTPNVHLILADVVEPKAPEGVKSVIFKADLTDPAEIDKLFNTELGTPDTIYCLHGIMSRGSEDNFDLGLKVNIDSIREMLQAARKYGSKVSTPIKFIFTSSLAVYGGPLPQVVKPDTIATPEGAYGMGKLSSELLVNEFSRRGFVDGRIVRLPTIVVRPGFPSAATSAFLSGIIREPLKGVEAICPVGDSLDSPKLNLAAWVASPEVTIKNLVVAKHIPADKFLKHTRVVCLPGFTTTVREELEALEKVAGKDALNLVKFKDDPTNRRIVSSWPARFDNSYPLSLGFVVDGGGMVPIVEQVKKDIEAGIA